MDTTTGIDRLIERAETLLLQQQPIRASAVARVVLDCDPESSRARHVAGLVAVSMGDKSAAVHHLSEAVRLKPSPQTLTDLGTVLYSLGDLAQADVCCSRAIELDRANAPARNVLAFIEASRGRDFSACAHLRELATLRPNDSTVLARLSLAEYAVGNIAETIRLVRDLIDVGNASLQLHSEYVSAHLYDPHQSGETIHRIAREWGERCCLRREPYLPHPRLETRRKLKIGYLSGEFGATPSRYFILPILRHHDRRSFSVTCYHTRRRDDAYTIVFRECVDRWRQCAELDDNEIADQIRADEIDILVDLSGHLRQHRLSVFALSPAPVQLAYPNYLGTTGMPAISHVFTDRWVCPRGSESQYSERPYYLSSGYLTYQPPSEPPAITPSPCDENGFITFGLFQWPGKLNPCVLDAVAAVLRACPNSRLLFHYSSTELDQLESPARLQIQAEFNARAIDSRRVNFFGSVSSTAYLALLCRADIALDTFPFNGVTTTCECLLVGVPVITLVGSTHSGRVGFEILDRLGLACLVASDHREYVEIAARLAADPIELRALRRRLRRTLRRSSLCNPRRMVRELEAGYRKLRQESFEKPL